MELRRGQLRWKCSFRHCLCTGECTHWSKCNSEGGLYLRGNANQKKVSLEEELINFHKQDIFIFPSFILKPVWHCVSVTVVTSRYVRALQAWSASWVGWPPMHSGSTRKQRISSKDIMAVNVMYTEALWLHQLTAHKHSQRATKGHAAGHVGH